MVYWSAWEASYNWRVEREHSMQIHPKRFLGGRFMDDVRAVDSPLCSREWRHSCPYFREERVPWDVG